jgi:hypothetical protein
MAPVAKAPFWSPAAQITRRTGRAPWENLGSHRRQRCERRQSCIPANTKLQGSQHGAHASWPEPGRALCPTGHVAPLGHWAYTSCSRKAALESFRHTHGWWACRQTKGRLPQSRKACRHRPQKQGLPRQAAGHGVAPHGVAVKQSRHA